MKDNSYRMEELSNIKKTMMTNNKKLVEHGDRSSKLITEATSEENRNILALQ